MPPKYPNTLLCLVGCIVVGLAMAGTTYVCAYRGMRTAWPFERWHVSAYSSIIQIKQALEDFHKEKGHYPDSLADLNGALTGLLRPNASGQILDPWDHPFEYRSDGQSYTLRSLGLDGKPGGPGLARDLDAREVVKRDGEHPYPRFRVRPTFSQYTFDLADSTPVKFVCALAGLFAAFACFVALHDRSVGLGATVARLVGTLLACFVVTSFMAILHTPSGH